MGDRRTLTRDQPVTTVFLQTHLSSPGISVSLPRQDAASHPLLGPVRHNSPRSHDLKSVAVDLEEPNLFRADPFGVRGSLDFNDPLVTIQAVRTRVGDDGVQEPGAI